MAGKSGLNLTMHEDDITFQTRIIHNNTTIEKALEEFGPIEVIEWDNRVIKNIVHYRYITRQDYHKICNNLNLFIETEAYYFLNEDLID